MSPLVESFQTLLLGMIVFGTIIAFRWKGWGEQGGKEYQKYRAGIYLAVYFSFLAIIHFFPPLFHRK